MPDDKVTLKTEAIARAEISKSRRSRFFGEFGDVRRVLRSNAVSQGGTGIHTLQNVDPMDVTLFYLDGEPHRARRAAIAPFFTAKAIRDKYEAVMHRCAEDLVGRLAASGGEDLGLLAFQYAVAVAADVIGLDYTDLEGLTERVGSLVADSSSPRPTRDVGDPALVAFYEIDVQPAIERSRRNPGDNVISTMLAKGHGDRFIRTEVRGYAVAGMLTTREFICITAWYLLENSELMEKFRHGDEDVQFAILDEVIRLEPIVGVVKREATEVMSIPELGEVDVGDILAVDIRKANKSEDAVGACPHAFDADRENALPRKSGYMSFGDGPHRCPGAMLAMHETRIFLDRLVRLEGLRLTTTPRVDWFAPIASYEIHDMHVACDRR